MMTSCLIVIDEQESFRHRPYYTDRVMTAYPAAQNVLIAGRNVTQAAGTPSALQG